MDTRAPRQRRRSHGSGRDVFKYLMLMIIGSPAGLALGAAGEGEGAAGATTPEALTEAGVIGQVTLSLLLVIAALLALAWVMRRLGRLQAQGGAGLRMVAGLALGTRERILLVEAQGIRLLVGVSPGGLRTLHVFDAPADDGDAPAGPGFTPGGGAG